jgi:hypothetical protein
MSEFRIFIDVPDGIKNLPDSRTIYRKNADATFKNADTPTVTWKSTNTDVLKIDEQTGAITSGSFSFAKIGDTTIQAIIDGQVIKEVSVKVTWQWWQWILVIVLLGWIYL